MITTTRATQALTVRILLTGATLGMLVAFLSAIATVETAASAQTVQPPGAPEEYEQEASAGANEASVSTPLHERPPHAGYAASEWRIEGADRESVSLAFTVDLLEEAAEMSVLDFNGSNVPLAASSTNGRTFTQRFARPLGDGSYTVRWQIIAADGHPMHASFALRFGEGTVAPEVTYEVKPSDGPAGDFGATRGTVAESFSAAPRSEARMVLFGFGGAALGATAFALVHAARRRTQKSSL